MSQHEQQRQAKGVPYISHLFAVSGLVWEDGGDEEQAIAALLHDAIVADCTDTNGSVAAGGKKEPWLLPKTRSIEHL